MQWWDGADWQTRSTWDAEEDAWAEAAHFVAEGYRCRVWCGEERLEGDELEAFLALNGYL